MRAHFSRLFVAAATLLTTPAVLSAQQTGALEGTVHFVGLNAPVPGAVIQIVGTRLGAITDDEGAFRLTGVPAGRYQIEAYRGASVERVEATVRAADTTRLRLMLANAPTELVGLEVIGVRSNALARIPGSAAVVTRDALRLQQPLSANEVLRRVTGVHLQEEEGVGMRANIGIRGLDPDRSRTVLVLEDGVPVALAPYGEPELYYSPPIDRMDRVEVVKGSGSIMFGPQTIGGVINYVTADAPVTPGGHMQVQGGTGGSLAARALYGGTWGSTRGTIGLIRRQASDLNGLAYHITDLTTKGVVRGSFGDVGLKVSIFDERSNATYVGLTDSLYRNAPHVHPQPDDELNVRRYAATGTHEIALSGVTQLRTSVYAYQTARNWERRDYTYNNTGSSLVFRETTGSRDRSFNVVGVEPRLRTEWSLGDVRSDLDLGVRAHMERARDQHVNGDLTTAERVLRDDELRRGSAIAAFVQNRFFLSDALQITPGVRAEYFEYDRQVLRTRVRRVDEDGNVTRDPEDVNLPRAGDALRELIPGIGAAWTPIQTVTVFAGAHRGFAPPRAKDALIYLDSVRTMDQQVPDLVSLQLDAERSWNYEVGARLAPTTFLSLEATAFRLDFSNQIIQPSASRGTPEHVALANQGATEHRGIETAVRFDAGRLLARPYSLAASVNLTAVDSRFSRDRHIVRAPGDTVNVKRNRLPYAPERLVNAALTFDHPGIGLILRLDGSWVGEQFSDLFETRTASANGRTGLIPSYRVFDLSGRYALPRLANAALIASVKNVLDETHMVSRRPEGIRVSLPRLISVGLSWGL